MNKTSPMTKSTRNRKAHPHAHPRPNPSEVEVRLEFTRSVATTVFVAGTFNEWRPTATPMIPIADGRWVKQLLLPPGRYEYCLVVDGEWMPDPQARECVPNPFGGLNSVLDVLSPN